MDESQTIRVSVEEAATLLGIEKSSVKKRIQRGKLRSERDASGTLYVYLDRSETVQDQSQGQSETDSPELVDELRSHIADLRAQLEAERRANDENRRLLAGLIERVPALEAPTEGTTPSEGREDASESAAEGGARVQAGQADTSPQSGSDKPWWRRVFGR